MGVYEERIGARSALATRPLPAINDRSQTIVRQPRRRLDTPTFISLLYGGFLLVWQALRFTPIGEWPPFEVVDIFGLALFVPLPVLLLFSMLCASRRAGLVLMVPILLLAATYGPLFLPRSIPSIFRASSPPSSTMLRVMTANLLVSNDDLRQVAGQIQAEGPDIVALQELSPEMAAYLAQTLRDKYPHQLLEPAESPMGLGILSRYPITSEHQGAALPRECFCQRVTFDYGGKTATLVNVHPWPPRVGYLRVGRLPIPTSFAPEQTKRALAVVQQELAGRTGPLIVLGDFNLSDRQPLYRELRRTLEDAHAEAGWGLGYSFPSLSFEGLPNISLVRIDYILHDRSFTARSTRTGTTPGSDHRHVVADLALR
jgi:endonuclease/exonuclease/phosphatase (EEP) superfamily protein YafD